MIHHGRPYSQTLIAAEPSVEAVAELARKLTEYSWTLCTGFRLGGYLFLNDATSEDSAQEYAIFEAEPNEDETHTQVESVTFGWLTPAQATAYLLSLYGLPEPEPRNPPPPPEGSRYADSYRDAIDVDTLADVFGNEGRVIVATSASELSAALAGRDAPKRAQPRAFAKHHLTPHPAGRPCSWCM